MLAKNEEIRRRHREVEEDKRKAKDTEDRANRHGKDDTRTATSKIEGNGKEEGQTPFQNPFGQSKTRERSKEAGASGTNWRSGTGGSSSAARTPTAATSRPTRLGEKDGPPPDPGYRYAGGISKTNVTIDVAFCGILTATCKIEVCFNKFPIFSRFLDDRLRDGSDDDEEDGYADSARRRSSNGFGPGGGRGSTARGRGAGTSSVAHRGLRRPNEPRNMAPSAAASPAAPALPSRPTADMSRRKFDDDNRNGSRPNAGQGRRESNEWTEERVGSAVREARWQQEDRQQQQQQQQQYRQPPPQQPPPHQQQQQGPGGVGAGGAQARLERARQQPSKVERSPPKEVSLPSVALTAWQCPDPGCTMANSAGTDSCSKCKLSFQNAQEYLINKGKMVKILCLNILGIK
jgi:hypothetical protein